MIPHDPWPLPAWKRLMRYTDVRLVLPVYYGRVESRKRWLRQRVHDLYGVWLLPHELVGLVALLSAGLVYVVALLAFL